MKKKNAKISDCLNDGDEKEMNGLLNELVYLY